MSDREYVHVGRHADVLSSGRPVGPGDRVPEAELTDEDAGFLDAGTLVDVDSFGDGPKPPKRDELLDRAKALGVEGVSKLTVPELVSAITKAEQEAADAA